MRLDHIAMYVNDLEATKAFFTRYFGATSNEMYHNPRTGLKSYFLSFDNGARLEIMSRPEVVDEGKKPFRAGYIHIAFSVGGKQQVDSITKRLLDDGYAVIRRVQVPVRDIYAKDNAFVPTGIRESVGLVLEVLAFLKPEHLVFHLKY